MEKAGSSEHSIVEIAQCAQILRVEKKEYWKPNRALCLAAKSSMQLVMMVKLL